MYGNPLNGAFQTSASASVNGYFRPLRIAGAQARRVLIDEVAANGTCRPQNLRPSERGRAQGLNRCISYGEIASFAKAPATMPKIEDRTSNPRLNSVSSARTLARVEVPTSYGPGQIRHGRAGPRHGLRGGLAVDLLWGRARRPSTTARRARLRAITDVVKAPRRRLP